MLILIILVVITALIFDYVNGFHDSANSISTVVSTGVLPLRTALIGAALLNFAGAFFGVAVAATIGKGIIDPAIVSQELILSALLGAITWNVITWYFGIPSSSSHALVGGLVGAGFAKAGVAALQSEGVIKVVKALVFSPMIGFGIGFVIMILMTWILRKARPATANSISRKLQVLSSAFMAFSHGGNDAQKTMGIITMSLVSYGTVSAVGGKFVAPTWVVVSCAIAMLLGTAAGGLRIIKTMGTKIVDLKPIHGFAAETGAATTILAASLFGMPVSTTHVIASSIAGVGASQNPNAVRWETTARIVWAWVLTIPASATVAWAIYHTVSFLLA